MNLDTFNSAHVDDARLALFQCCTSQQWVDQVVDSRPFANINSVYSKADDIWRRLSEDDYLEAFDGHPKIGDVNSLKEKYQSTKALASKEQSSVASASDDVINQLADKNNEYHKKYGFIFIVCATGKSASQMLTLLVQRLANDRATELTIAAQEQRKIYQLRLRKLLGEPE